MSLSDLQNKLEQKLDLVCSSLDILKNQQKVLQENEEKVKCSITNATETQVNSLRGKEKQLIRQVEVVTAHQKSLIDSQLAKLMHTKGSVTAAQEILQKYKPEDIESLSRIIDGNMPSSSFVSQCVPPLKVTCVHLDVTSLSTAIRNFATLHLPDTITHQPSAVIPAKMEDYGDSEHDVLHKSIGSNSEVSLVKIQFPKIPTNDWLLKPNQHNHKRPLTVTTPLERKVSRDVSSWLADLRVSQNLEDSNKQKSSFDLDDEYCFMEGPCSSSKGEGTESVSSSIEVVQCPESEKDTDSQIESDFVTIKSRWLSDSKLSFLLDEKVTSKKISPSLSPSFVKVPSLSLSQPSSPIVIEEFACQANETCGSYEDCVRNGYCKELANERMAQSSMWLSKKKEEVRVGKKSGVEEVVIRGGKKDKENDKEEIEEKRVSSVVDCCQGKKVGSHPSLVVSGCDTKKMVDLLSHQCGVKRKFSLMEGMDEVLAHMTDILKSDSSKWLSKRSCTDHCNVASITYTPPSKSWLCQSVNPTSDPTKPDTIIQFSPHSNIWLLHKYKEELKTQKEKECTIDSSLDQENSSEYSVSVSELKGSLAELSVLVPKFSTFTIKSDSDVTQAKKREPAYHQDTLDLKRKLRWLSNAQSKYSLPGQGDINSRSDSFLPETLMALANSNLDKWLANRV